MRSFYNFFITVLILFISASLCYAETRFEDCDGGYLFCAMLTLCAAVINYYSNDFKS